MHLNRFKPSSFAEATAAGLEIEPGLALIPVGSWILNEDALIAQMAEWRQQSMAMFFAQFDSTAAKTRQYLTNASLGQDNRLLFMISDHDVLVGHIGISNATDETAEIDNVMRGIKHRSSQVMAKSLNRLSEWCFEELGLDWLTLKVSSINDRAIALYEACGFVVTESRALKLVETPELTQLTECDDSESNVEQRCLIMTRSN